MFCDARYQNTYLPLWAIPFCRSVYDALSKREVVLACLKWLEGAAVSSSALERSDVLRARETLLRLPWQGNVCDDLDVSLFLRLLSDAEISDGLVDSLVQWTIREARPNSSASSYFVHGIAVWDYIGDKDQSYWEKDGSRRLKFMNNLEAKLKSASTPQKLLFPVRLSLGKDGNGRDRGHFLIVEIDPIAMSFTLGE